MGDILELIKTRRNVEEFYPKPVSWEKISKCIHAARYAPSSGNLQNWKFIVVTDGDKKHTLAEIAHQQYEIANAFALVIVCGDPEKAERYYGIRGSKLYTIQNCAAAIQNMMLEAHSLGLASRWIGAFDEPQLKDTFAIPPHIRPQAIIAIGHPKHVPNKPPKFPLEGVVFLNGWGGTIEDFSNWYYKIPAENLAGNLKQVKDDFGAGVEHIKEKLQLHPNGFRTKVKEKLRKLSKKQNHGPK